MGAGIRDDAGVVTKECEGCGGPFPANTAGRPRRYCSERCRAAAYRERCRPTVEQVMAASWRLTADELDRTARSTLALPLGSRPYLEDAAAALRRAAQLVDPDG